MRIDGSWWTCDDGIVRPVVELELQQADLSWVRVPFLIDSGADRTVLSRTSTHELGLPLLPGEVQLEGVGGAFEVASVETRLRFADRRGNRGSFQSRFPVALDEAVQMSILGRDVLDCFAVIFDRPNETVLLLTSPDSYEVHSPA
jgi:hypothetical protein